MIIKMNYMIKMLKKLSKVKLDIIQIWINYMKKMKKF